MKKTLLLLAAAASILTSCKKSNPAPAAAPTVLLTDVIDNTPGDFYIGKPLSQFTYNGKQLTQVVIYDYLGYTNGTTPYDVETHAFHYDSQGNLTGTTISHTQSFSFNDVSSTVTYNGGDISEIKVYFAGNVLDGDLNLSYQNGKISNLAGSYFGDDYTYKYAYTFDSNSNVTNDSYADYYSNNIVEQYPTTYTSFDSKPNITQTVPFWPYFKEIGSFFGVFYTPSTNNILAATYSGGSSDTFSYQYDSNGYPSTMSIQGSYSFSYQYITVN